MTVTVGTHPEGFHVADDGPGIPAESSEDVFDARYATSKGATGPELSIGRRILEAHGWEVSVAESPDGDSWL